MLDYKRLIRTLVMWFILLGTVQLVYNYINIKGYREGYKLGVREGHTLGVEEGYNEYTKLYGETCELLPEAAVMLMCGHLLKEKYTTP